MVWVPPNDTDEKQEEMNGNNDVVVRTHYQTRDSAPGNYSRRDKKKTYCFVLLLILFLGLIVSTIVLGIRGQRYKEQYDMLSVRTSGSLYRLNVYGSPVLDLNQINMETWGNTAQSVLNDCLVGPGEVNEAAIDAECFKNAIHALRRLYKK